MNRKPDENSIGRRLIIRNFDVGFDDKEDDPLMKSMRDGKWEYSKAGGQGYFHKAMNDDSEKDQVRSMLAGLGMHEVEKLTDTKTKENTRENTRYHGR